MNLKMRLAGCLILFFVGASASMTLADSVKSVIVTNNSGYTMNGFYASSSSSADWSSSSNLIAAVPIANGATATVSIVDISTTSGCNYDLMAVVNGLQHAYTYGVNVCGTGAAWTISSTD